MIEFATITISGLFFLYLGYRIGSRRTKSKLDKQISFYDSFIKDDGTGRYGVVRVTDGYSGLATIEIREIASASRVNYKGTTENWVKFQILKVYPDYGCGKSMKEILEKYGYSEWCPEREVIWFDDNDARMRDEKLKNLLNK